jgi:hypothetical protein
MNSRIQYSSKVRGITIPYSLRYCRAIREQFCPLCWLVSLYQKEQLKERGCIVIMIRLLVLLFQYRIREMQSDLLTEEDERKCPQEANDQHQRLSHQKRQTAIYRGSRIRCVIFCEWQSSQASGQFASLFLFLARVCEHILCNWLDEKKELYMKRKWKRGKLCNKRTFNALWWERKKKKNPKRHHFSLFFSLHSSVE